MIFLPYTVNPPKVGNSWSVLLQLVPNTCSASRIMHARLNLLFLKKAFTWNMKTTRIYKFFFVVVLNDWGTVTNNMSRMHQWLQRKYPAYVSLQQKRRKDSRASKESMFTGISLTRSLYKLHWGLMRWDNWFDFKQSVQINKSVEQYSACIPTTQIRAGPTYTPSSSSASSSAVSLSCTVLTRGDVRWIIRVRTDSLVLVTTMAASPGHWLTAYVSGELVY